jgi:hypothetical protein
MGPTLRARLVPSLAIATCTLLFSARPAFGFATEEVFYDAPTLAVMEARAASAEAREQCFLYTELLHGWTELAGREMNDGDSAAALVAVQHADADAARLKASLSRDSKRLKNAELLLEHSVHRLSDMLRVAGMDEQDSMQAVVRHISSVHDELLAAVFTH